MSPRQKGFDLNTMLHVANVSVLVAAISTYRMKGGNEYADLNTLGAACLLALSNVVMLRYERRHKDPFIVILVLMTVLFYLVRVATLFYTPSSWYLDKVSAGPHEVNQATIFVTCGNLALFAGFALAGRRTATRVHVPSSTSRLPHPAMIVLMAVLSLVMTQLLSDFGVLGRVAGFLDATLLNTYFLTLIAVLYLSMCGRRVHRLYAIAIIGLVAFVFLRTVLGGSRAALLEVVMFGLIASLVHEGRPRIGSRMLAMGLVVCLMAPYFYFTATYLRNVPLTEQGTVSFEAIKTFEGSEASSVVNRDVLFGLIFERIGYLDAATAMVAGRTTYAEVIGVKYVIESAIDNALTPGFDVFDRAKIALVLGNLDRGVREVPRRSALSRDEYNSDMMTVYGEAYLFFGYGGLIFLFVGAYAGKRVYLWYRSRHVFEVYIFRSIVLWCFYRWLSSYGTDWLLSEVITAIVFFAVFRQYSRLAGRKGPEIRIEGSGVKVASLPRVTSIPLGSRGAA
jgi:hypothetical protein